ncbi:hypothetical protein K469DRAFT_664736 [Zopfia rhizophila CBS 207.26]|uniref:FAD-binding FR-type domain-containing protein n=1 Tax=Zopfia rhizophila CBS 207.26 TaxID=1314779 RepID=A0A6A6E1T7_9PEZI|nr:hypothetical protein K469DRAFT_664736 [Zopfia rhizophila CBS 207.26]
MRTSSLIPLALTLPGLSFAFIGYGISMYKPNCAFACRSSIEAAMLACSSHDHGGGGHSHGGSGMTSPECRAGDTPFLTTLAYCINSTCAQYNVEAWKLEKYWADKTTGDKAVVPKWTYAQALAQVEEPPTEELEEDATLNFTAKVNEETWNEYRETLKHFELAETVHSQYGLILLVLGFGTPIVFTLLGYLPYMSGILEKLKPRFVYPSILGTYHVRPLPFLLGNAPTVGQTLYIIMFLILNIILTAAGYRSTQPNMWFSNRWQEIMGYVSARTGVLAFALAPLVVLFSGRNNFLLWVTNWSHSTYMLLHRWVARIFALQVILHSITELVLYMDMGEFEAETKKPYWIWGIVGTLAVCIMLVISVLFFRRLSYEVFLISHIIMAVFVIAGSWYHVELLFTRKWGYELWLYAMCAVWFFDRLVRVLRILKNGVRRANVTEVSEEIVRIDVKCPRWSAEPGKHTYAYFPGLNPLRPWENHPFSVIPTALLQSRGHSIGSSSSKDSSHEAEDIEKSGAAGSSTEIVRGGNSAGVSLYVRKSTGMTKALTSHNSLLTLLDGPYPNNANSGVLKSDRLVLIAGGIGITAILPFTTHHSNIKLYWSVRSAVEGLVRDLDKVLGEVREKDVRIGKRLDVEALLSEEEGTGWSRIGVVVCGPGGLCDDVRSSVARRGREGKTVWELDVEAFSW